MSNLAVMNGSRQDDDRVVALEIRAAEQERVLEELSGQLAAQWAAIERLQKRLDALVERFLAVEDAALPRPESTRPPHY